MIRAIGVKNIFIGFITIFLFINISSCVFAIEDLTADKIVSFADNIIDPGNFIADLTMTVKRPEEEDRIYKMKMNGSGSDKMLITFEYPSRYKGQAFLKVEEDMWIYMPNINKTLRIPNNNSFAGGDFNNSDVLSVRLDRDYKAEFMSDEIIEGVECYCFNLIAINKNVPYASIKYWINKKNYWPIKRVFFSLSGKPLKTLLIKSQSGKQPDTFVMSNILEKQKISIMNWTNLKKVTHNPRMFSESYLTRRR